MQPGASIPLLCLLLLAGASSGLNDKGPFPRVVTAAAAVAPSGAVEGAVEAVEFGGEQGRRQLLTNMMDEEWNLDVEEEEEEDEAVVAMELAPPCGAFPTLVWGGQAGYLGGQGVYETRR